MNSSKKTLGIALTAAFAATGAMAADSGFAMKPMAQGYMVAEASTQAATGDAKKSEGTTPKKPAKKSTAKAKPKTKASDGKCGGKAGAEKAAEGSCGGKSGNKMPAGKCAPGACGGNMGK
jgi:uncharacterized low-complexity protein